MKYHQKHLSKCLLAIAALLGGASTAFAQVSLGAASDFSVLGGTAVTCTAGSVVGNVGISPGITASYTNTGCAIAGTTPLRPTRPLLRRMRISSTPTLPSGSSLASRCRATFRPSFLHPVSTAPTR